MTRLVWISCVGAALAGCATAPPDRTVPPRAVVELEAGKVFRWDFSPDVVVSSDYLRVPATSAWLALPEVYAHFDLRPTGHAADRVVAAEVRVRRVIGGVRLSRIVDCGSALGVKRADHYTITLTVATRVDSMAREASVLRTRVQATGFDPEANSNTITCATTGFLERAIADEVQARAK